MATGVQQVTTPQVTPQIPTSAPIEREFTVKSRSQTQQALRRFMHNKLAMAALFVYVVLLLVSFIYPHFYRWTFDEQDASSLSVGPGTNGHPFGTDEIGQDLLARMMMGIQRSTYISVIFVLVAGTIGVLIGAISGYFGKWVDNVLMRIVDIILTVPILVAIIVIANSFPSARSPIGIALFIALLGWMDLARIVRSSFLSLREREYVEAAHALGASDRRIITNAFDSLCPGGRVLAPASAARHWPDGVEVVAGTVADPDASPAAFSGLESVCLAGLAVHRDPRLDGPGPDRAQLVPLPARA